MAGPGPVPAPSPAVLALLRQCYAEAAPLDTFVRRLGQGGPGDPALLRDGDTPQYRCFVRQCLVCVPRGARAIPRPFAFRQVSHQSEVVERVVQRLCEKRKKNVLAYGYSLLDGNCSDFPIMPYSNVYSYLPNTATETLRMSDLWETLLSRIGDDVMMYLLEHCAVFMLVPPSNCYQVCGQPVYELISQNADSSPVFVKQRFPRRKLNSLLKYVRKRLEFHGRYLSRRQKCRQRPEDNVSRMGNKRKKKTRSSAPSYQHSTKTLSKAREQTRGVTEHLGQQGSSSSCLSSTVLSRKRKLHREGLEIPAKRAKVVEKVRGEKACNLTPDVNQSCSKRYETGCVASHPESIKNTHVSQRSNGAMPGPSLVHTSCGRKKFVAGESSLQRGVQSNKPLKSGIEMQVKSCRKGVGMHTCESQLNSVQIKPMAGNSSKCRRQESPLPHSANQLPSRLMPSAVYIDRRSLLYSHRSFRESFPKSFLLNSLQGCRAGGRRLVETIFLSQNLLDQKYKPSLPHCKWKKKRLPKRYWQMRHTFQKLLKKHRKCHYLALLKKNCPVRMSEVSERKTNPPGQAEVRDQTEQFGKEPADCVESSRCEFGHALVSDNLHAPLAKSVCGELQSEEQNPGEVCDSTLLELLRQHSSHWQVYMFVRECLHKVIPVELWGSNHNKCRFLKNVKSFISRGRFVKFSLQELMWRMRVNDCMWLRLSKGNNSVPAEEHRFREELLAKFLYWLMDTYVVELLRSFFYITETMFQKNMLFYYRKFIWGKLQNLGIRNHFSRVRLRALSSEEIKAVHQKKIVPMASRLRFIPKPNGLRPIVKVSGVVETEAFSKENKQMKLNRYNTQLKNLFSVLNYERSINPSILGSSAFGRDDIYNKWKQFVTKVLDSGSEIPHFYFVKADVSRAYDTIPHKKLVEVISQILKPEKRTTYCIRRYAMVMVTRRGEVRRRFKIHVSTFKDFMPDMKRFVSQLQETTSLQNAIVVEQPSFCARNRTEKSMEIGYMLGQFLNGFYYLELGWSIITAYKITPASHDQTGVFSQVFNTKSFINIRQTVIRGIIGNVWQSTCSVAAEQSLSCNETSSSLFNFFLQMIHYSVLEIDNRYYVQCCGIPQGSILSTLLCSLCYGDMENKLFCGVQQDGILIRLIDDFLLVTPHLSQARTFLRTLATGIPEYGFLINPSKTVVNFPIDGIPECSKFKQLPDCHPIPWCGLLIDTKTLEVYCDYSSYNYTSIRSSLSFNSSRTAGKNMENKLFSVLKLKCQDLFLDLQINSLRTVLINIYKIFLLQAYRFHACVLQLPFNQQVRKNPNFFLRIISQTASCCYSILKAKNEGIDLGRKGASGMLPSEAAEWLCYHAFTVKLSNHKIIYKCLLKPLNICKMQLFRKISKDTKALLKAVTEPSLCQDFRTILD